MITSNHDKLQHHTDPKTGKHYVSTTDASGKHTLTVDEENAWLLRDVSWTVVPVRKGSTSLHARAASKSPRVRKGQLLHRKVCKRLASHRQVRALDGNLLNATRANLQVVSRRDVVLLKGTRQPEKLVGVRFARGPSWLKSEKFWHASIRIEGKRHHLGSFLTAHEAACAFDGAARRAYGLRAVTNQSLALVPENVVRSRVCRKAARVGRRKVAAIIEAKMIKRAREFADDPSTANFVAMALANRHQVQPRARLVSFGPPATS